MKALPERWAVLRTLENYQRVNTWVNTHKTSRASGDCYKSAGYIIYPTTYAHTTDTIPSGYALISTEDFDTLVLKGVDPVTQQIVKKEKLELKGKYRERIKELEDEIVKLKHENSKLWDELAKK